MPRHPLSPAHVERDDDFLNLRTVILVMIDSFCTILKYEGECALQEFGLNDLGNRALSFKADTYQ